MGNTFGSIYKMTTFGESHGHSVGVVIDGCPANISIDLEKIQHHLNRRKPGQNKLTTQRKETDQVTSLSGMENQTTLGSSLAFAVQNQDKRPQDYGDMEQVFRPSHADYTTFAKYGVRASSGGGRASARETIGRVISGAVAEQVLNKFIPTLEIIAWVDSIHKIQMPEYDLNRLSRDEIDLLDTRCPDKKTNDLMEKLIIEARKSGDSVGGIIRCIIKNCPVGLGSPVFDKFEAELAKAMMSLPATKGFEIGSGFASTKMYGSQHNDLFYKEEDKVKTKTNFSGGIQGGITNGEIIDFKVAFKPVATIFRPQETINQRLDNVEFQPKAGRHDPCVLPRAVPIVEAMAAHVILDQYLRQNINKL